MHYNTWKGEQLIIKQAQVMSIGVEFYHMDPDSIKEKIGIGRISDLTRPAG